MSIPPSVFEEIRIKLPTQQNEWGRIYSHASVEGHSWQTEIWYDTKIDIYLLPIKAELKAKANLPFDCDLEIRIHI